MGVLGILGFGFFTFASLMVGVRLLAVAARTRALPEAAFGTALFFGGVGYVLIVLGFRAVVVDHAPFLVAAGNLLLHIGSMSLVIATWRVFRPNERWPALGVAALATLLSVSFATRLSLMDVIPPPASVFWTSTLGDAAAYAWSAAESLRFWLMMRRRETLGLADRAVTRRVGFWSLFGICAVAMHAATIAGRLLGREAMPAAVVVASSTLGLVAAMSLWLAFFRRSERSRSQGPALTNPPR
jgi:hypothetical protein